MARELDLAKYLRAATLSNGKQTLSFSPSGMSQKKKGRMSLSCWNTNLTPPNEVPEGNRSGQNVPHPQSLPQSLNPQCSPQSLPQSFPPIHSQTHSLSPTPNTGTVTQGVVRGWFTGKKKGNLLKVDSLDSLDSIPGTVSVGVTGSVSGTMSGSGTRSGQGTWSGAGSGGVSVSGTRSGAGSGTWSGVGGVSGSGARAVVVVRDVVDLVDSVAMDSYTTELSPYTDVIEGYSSNGVSETESERESEKDLNEFESLDGEFSSDCGSDCDSNSSNDSINNDNDSDTVDQSPQKKARKRKPNQSSFVGIKCVSIKMKVLADFMEALIGAFYAAGGMSGAVAAIRAIGCWPALPDEGGKVIGSGGVSGGSGSGCGGGSNHSNSHSHNSSTNNNNNNSSNCGSGSSSGSNSSGSSSSNGFHSVISECVPMSGSEEDNGGYTLMIDGKIQSIPLPLPPPLSLPLPLTNMLPCIPVGYPEELRRIAHAERESNVKTVDKMVNGDSNSIGSGSSSSNDSSGSHSMSSPIHLTTTDIDNNNREIERITRAVTSISHKIGYTFKDPSLLNTAFTHCSVQHSLSNQRLEFLGDAVLDFVVVKQLHRYCKYGHTHNRHRIFLLEIFQLNFI